MIGINKQNNQYCQLGCASDPECEEMKKYGCFLSSVNFPSLTSFSYSTATSDGTVSFTLSGYFTSLSSFPQQTYLTSRSALAPRHGYSCHSDSRFELFIVLFHPIHIFLLGLWFQWNPMFYGCYVCFPPHYCFDKCRGSLTTLFPMASTHELMRWNMETVILPCIYIFQDCKCDCSTFLLFKFSHWSSVNDFLSTHFFSLLPVYYVLHIVNYRLCSCSFGWHDWILFFR